MGIIFSWLWENDPYAEEGLFCPEDVIKYYGDKFYLKGVDFWCKQDQTNAGMLGGYTYTHDGDINYSTKKLEEYINQHNLGRTSCVDFGSGIGRISKNVLSKFFAEIHLVEPVESFLDVAKRDIKSDSVKLHLHICGAQDFIFEGKHDCFWVQWTIMFLTDDDAVSLLRNCKNHLNRYGKIFVKDNGIPEIDDKKLAQWNPSDHSFARSHEGYLELFKKAGLKVVEDTKQPDWDTELLPLFFFVLR